MQPRDSFGTHLVAASPTGVGTGACASLSPYLITCFFLVPACDADVWKTMQPQD